MAFKRIKDPKNEDRGYLPLGTIQVTWIGFNSTTVKGPDNGQVAYASPFAGHTKVIPLVGEIVNIVTGVSALTNRDNRKRGHHYYTTPLSVHGSVHANPLPNHTWIRLEGGGIAAGVQDAEDYDPDYVPGQNFEEVSDVRSLQPFEGDVLMEGRHGHGLRFSAGYTRGDVGQYQETATWEDKGGNAYEGAAPITILSNGFKDAKPEDVYRIESPDNTDSIIMLTSTHKILNFTPSQKFEPGIPIAENEYPQVIITSDRLHFDAKEQTIIMTAKQDVIIATPDWSTQMNELLNILDEFMNEVRKLTNEEATFATGAGPTGIATNNAQIKALLDRLRKMKQ